MNDSIIQISELGKTYVMGAEKVHALKSITLNIKKNEYVALMGPSGSGKSTLMNLLGCLDTPTKGKYLLNGTDVSTMEDDDLAEVRNKEIGFVFQTFNLLPRLSSLDNVALPLVYSGLNKTDRREKANVALTANTIILVTHEPDIAEHAHRIIRLRDGLVEQDIVNDNIVSAYDAEHRYNQT